MKHRMLSLLLALAMVLTLMPGAVQAADDENIVEYDGLQFNKATHTVEKYLENRQNVVIPREIEGEEVQAIGSRAFDGSTVASVVIPHTVTLIGDNAFDDCSNLTSVTLQDGGNAKLEIGQRAFAKTKLTDVVLPTRTQVLNYGAFMDNDELLSVVVRQGVSFGPNVFTNCGKLENVVIPGGKYNSNPFFDCKELKIIHYLGSSAPDIPSLDTAKVEFHPAEELASGTPTVVDRCIRSGRVPQRVDCRNSPSCGFQIDATRSITAMAHTTEIIPAVAPTCAASGATEGKRCTVCRQIVVKPKEIPALDHTYIVTVERTEPKCNEPGELLTKYTCSVCGNTYDEREVLEATNLHTYAADTLANENDWTVFKEATCTEPGRALKPRACKDCGTPETIDEEDVRKHRADPAYTDEHVVEAIAPLGHSSDKNQDRDPWILDPTVPGQDYDCTVGSGDQKIHVVYQCTRCREYPENDAAMKAEIKTRAGQHSYGEKKKIVEKSKDATCEEAGLLVTQRTCSVCGKKEGEVTEEIPALGHNVPEWRTTREPTCLAEGERTGRCTNPGCGREIKESIDALGHDFESEKAKQETTRQPTCTTEGELTITCGREGCDDGESHEDGQIHPATTKKPIDLLPHSPKAPEESTVLREPTCTDEGSRVYNTTCVMCGAPLQNTPIPIPALGHSFGPWTTTGGKRTRTCQREGCGYSETSTSTVPSQPSDPSKPSDPSDPSTPGSSGTTYYSVDVIRPANGSISVSTSRASAGTRVYVTLRPNSGYQLDSVRVTRSGSGSSVSLSGEGTNRYSFRMPSSRVEVRAVFYTSSRSSTTTPTTEPNDRNTNPTKNPVTTIPQISSANTPAGSRVFVDVPSTFWAEGEIAWACQRGFVSGSGGNFYPNNPITVRQLWMVMARMMGQNPTNMEDARVWALNNGFSDGGNPSAALSRIQLMTMLYRCARLMGSTNVNTTNLGVFTDSRSIPAASKNAVAWAVANGILTGTADGRLNPSGTVSRAQFCVILYRYYQRLF